MTTTEAPEPTSDADRFADVANQLAGRPAPPVTIAAPERLDGGLAERWTREGFFVLRGVVDRDLAAAVADEAIALVRRLATTGEDLGGYRRADGMISVPEPNLVRGPTAPRRPEDHVSKLFNLHRRDPFRSVARHPEITAVLGALLGADVDCFNSQFIFKNPGAWGQPWHQDSLYFDLDRAPQVGVWLATSPATADNGCLHVAPGSHAEPLHHHVPDRRPDANLGYLEIVDHDFSDAVPVEMLPGDVLVFHSFLMHRSGDNSTDARRTALVLHHTPTGTAPVGTPSGTVDFMPVVAGFAPLA
jgi:ectoine hydroxylase-related dioxygenase (phytanoyl-CoA dioxygenase family)